MEILYRDEDILVVVKPRGALSEDRGADSVPALLAATEGQVYTVHRLDRGVGGVMVYARHKKAAAALTAAIQAGTLRKEYTAVVTGALAAPEGELRDHLYHDARQNKTFVADSARKGAKEAILTYRLIDKMCHNGVDFSRFSIQLQTGRTHQIRVQLASRKCPLVGDGKYGSRQKAPYPALYATALSFPHPKNRKNMRFFAPVPGDFPWNLFGEAHYEIERKLLIAYPDPALLTAQEGCRVKHIEQTYLTAPAGETARVRRVREGERVRYIHTVKRRVNDLRATEEERELDADGYAALLAQADPARRPVKKTRYCIPYGGHLLEIDLYDFWRDRATLEVELTDEQETFALPPYISVLRDVTADKRYKNVNLAKDPPTDPL